MEPPVSTQLRLDVVEAFERYRNAEGVSEKPQQIYRSAERVSERERIEKLQRVIDQAEQLRETLAGLDSHTWRAIAAQMLSSRAAVDPRALVPKLKMLGFQARHAKRHAAPPRRGPRRKDSLRQLIADLGIAWQIEHPDVKGIVARADGERRGPMLDFVYRELKREHVEDRSRQAVGKMLYGLRALILERAEAARGRKLVTQKDGLGVTVVSIPRARARRRRSG